jgi:predicted RNA-binding protein YlqC (UPF0109 family)
MNEENIPSEIIDPLAESELLTEILRSFVLHPNDVRVEEKTGDKSSMLTIHINPDDIGIVIGRDHSTITALRHLFGKIAAANEIKTFIHIAGEDAFTNRPRNNFNNDRPHYNNNNNNNNNNSNGNRVPNNHGNSNGYNSNNYGSNERGPRVVRTRRPVR